MKNSLLILGITLVFFTNVCHAKSMSWQAASLYPIAFFTEESDPLPVKEPVVIAKPVITDDEEVFNPQMVIPFSSKTVKESIAEGDKIIENTPLDDLDFILYEESMREIIAQGDLIIESTVSNVTYPLFNERTIEEEIVVLESIIESKEANEIFPLDFKKINGGSVTVSSLNCRELLGMQ